MTGLWVEAVQHWTLFFSVECCFVGILNIYHWDKRHRKYGYSRWNFSDTPFQCADITTSGYSTTISISGVGRRRIMLTIVPIGQASPKTWVEPLEFLRYLNQFPSYKYFRFSGRHLGFLAEILDINWNGASRDVCTHTIEIGNLENMGTAAGIFQIPHSSAQI